MTAKIPAILSIVKQITYGFFLVYDLPRDVLERACDELTRLLEDNCIEPFIAAHLPIEEIVDAHRMVDDGKAIGNIVVTVQDSIV
ncbi:zinc-binding dehydrogenase [uncultured Roseobacter sp.]|uniref:zinc-binding dehydrogenase n=1 Tax=uncultured Roseobacter sp. TaxID=114847 RepID=UPI003450764B